MIKPQVVKITGYTRQKCLRFAGVTILHSASQFKVVGEGESEGDRI